MPRAGSFGQVALRGLHRVEVWAATDVRRAEAPKRNVKNGILSLEVRVND